MPKSSESGAGSRLTVLLTLKDRAPFTYRWLSYASSINFPFKVFIADGGADEGLPRVLADRSRFPNLDYDYRRFPYDATYSDYYRKIGTAISEISTPFIVFADNDDFFTIRGLSEATRFLEQYPDYSACGGQTMVFWLEAQAEGDAAPVYGSRVEHKICYDIITITADRARDRILHHLHPFYCVKRTEEVRRQFEMVQCLGLRDLFLFSDLVDFLTLIAGKIQALPGLYLARQWNTAASSSSDHEQKFGDWLGRMMVPSWSEDFGKFLDAIARELASADRIPFEEARQCAVAAYRAVLAPRLLPNLLDEPSVTPWMPTIVSLVRRIGKLPGASKLRGAARQMYRRLPWVPVDFVSGERLVARPGSAREEFDAVARFVTRATNSVPKAEH